MGKEFEEDSFRAHNPWQLADLGNTAAIFSCALTGPEPDLPSLIFERLRIPELDVQEELKLPEIDSFRYGSLENIEAPDESSVSDAPTNGEDLQEELDFIWQLTSVDQSPTGDVRFHSWEAFENAAHREPPSAYLSEAGEEAFDAALRAYSRETQLPEAAYVVREEVFLKSISAMCLGRSSALFNYDREDREFCGMLSEQAPSGLTPALASSYMEKAMRCGKTFRYLQDFAASTFASRTASQAKVSLASCVDQVLEAVELHLSSLPSSVCSLLQIQAKIEKPRRLLLEINKLVRSARNARSKEDMATLAFTCSQRLEEEPDWIRSVMLQIVANVSRPWLETAERWIGIKNESGVEMSQEEETSAFIVLDDGAPDQQYGSHTDQQAEIVFRPERLPSFMTLEDGKTMFNIGRDIRILRNHHANHPLAQTRIARNECVCLEWHFDWESVERVAAKAKSFELALTTAAVDHQATPSELAQNEPESTSGTCSRAIPVADEAFKFAGEALFQSCRKSCDTRREGLIGTVISSLMSRESDAETAAMNFAPPVAVTPTLSFHPLLSAYKRVVNATMLRLFFRDHRLRLHLDLQRNFHLLGDGVFASRLSAALFDPERASTERRHGSMRGGSVMGLRLGSRGTWPPASSELRLALMGILEDCYLASFGKTLQETTSSQDLPGNLSFAIRQLPDQEAERILNSNSLYALDFLRLQYTAPPPMQAILTAHSLERYDLVFKFLLRLNRLLFVVAHQPKSVPDIPEATLYRQQAEHFVTACCRYFFETGISETWSSFSRYLDDIERGIRTEDAAGEMGTQIQEGLEDIRARHELCLDRITFALLLRHRQQKVMDVLERIFSNVLQFSKSCLESGPSEVRELCDLENLHEAFLKDVKLFLDVCKGLASKKTYGRTDRSASEAGVAASDENTIERLVLALEYNGFYERRVL